MQVLPDGADYESSVPYHRLVTELFLGAARLADTQGGRSRRRMRERLREMVDFLAAVAAPRRPDAAGRRRGRRAAAYPERLRRVGAAGRPASVRSGGWSSEPPEWIVAGGAMGAVGERVVGLRSADARRRRSGVPGDGAAIFRTPV